MIEIRVTSKNLKQIAAGRLAEKYNFNGSRVLRYYIDFKHTALNLYKELSAPEISILQNKVDVLIAFWDKKFEEFQRKSQIAAGKDSADQMTIEAETKLASLSGILAHTLKIDDRVNWDSIKDFSRFSKPSHFAELAPFRQRADKSFFKPPT
jgi:restriction system protein